MVFTIPFAVRQALIQFRHAFSPTVCFAQATNRGSYFTTLSLKAFLVALVKPVAYLSFRVSAAYDQGMSKQTQIYAVADGGNGLREALQAQFLNLTFILDRPHLKQHLYESAEAIGLTGEERHKWVSDRLHKIDAGDVRHVIRILKGYHGQGKDRITNLSEYLKRFIDAVDYDYFRAKGLPIGSGEVESAHRYIPQKRLRIPGAIWHPDTVNPMLALRIIRSNGWWDDFWMKQSASARKPHSCLTRRF